MDRFVTRAPTWKTLEMSSFSRSFANVSLTGKKSTPKEDKSKLQQANKRLSIRDEKLIKIFTSLPDEPLIVPQTQDLSPYTSRYNGSFGGDAAVTKEKNSFCLISNDENTPPPNSRITFKDQVAVDVLRSSGESNSRPSTPINNMIPSSLASCTPKDNPFLARIQKDLNSPSAAIRIRALKALKSPTKSAYANFDIPHEEQDIITEEERKSPEKVASIQELMKDVVVYVEVRTGEDNRSSGVKKVISALGAKVNDKLLRDTTHVVFKDGLQSTYNKAKKWNIPIVSILWIEACKKQMRIMSPKDFPISNADRYENPELYDKMKRYKSMQPDAEENRRRAKLPVKENGIKSKAVTTSQSSISSAKKKNDISRFFTHLEKSKSMPCKSSDMESPSEKMLQKINEKFCTPKAATDSLQKLAYLDTVSSLSDTPDLHSVPCSTRKMLEFEEDQISSTPTVKKTPSRRRNSLQVAQTPKTTGKNQTNNEKSIPATPGMQTRRRSSIHIPTNMCLSEKEDDTKVPHKTIDTISEEIGDSQEAEKRQTTFSQVSVNQTCNQPTEERNKNRRRTLYTPAPMEESKPQSIRASASKRRTMFATSKTSNDVSLAMSSFAPITPIGSGVPTSTLIGEESVKTPVQFSSLLEEHASATIFSSSRTPVNPRRRTLFDVSMDIISQRLQNINQSAKSVRVNKPDDLQNIEQRSSIDDPTKIVALLTPTDNNNRTIRKELFAENLDSVQKQPIKETPIQVDKPTTNTSGEALAKKKRKLFVPNEVFLTPTQSSVSSTLEETSKRLLSPAAANISTSAALKRRKTIMPTLTQTAKTEQKKPAPKTNTGSVARSTRRSTLDFETIKKAKSVSNKSSETTKQTAIATNASKSKPYPFLVYTNMHTEQIKFIKEAISKLGVFQLEDIVSDNTTHIVSLEARRTMNLLRGLARGLWILNYDWILESVKAGKWLNEEQYELKEFSRAIEICRSERQAFGKGYKMDLFSEIGPIFISAKSKIPKDNLKELILLCAGRVVDTRQRAKYIIGDTSPNQMPDKIYIEPQWILDSISCNLLQKITKYNVNHITTETGQKIEK